MGAVVFFVFIILPGQSEPLRYTERLQDTSQCAIMVRDFVDHPPHEVLIKGGVVQAGCARELEPSVEH